MKNAGANIYVSRVVAAAAMAVPFLSGSDARAQTTVNPVQTTTFALDPAQNPITFGPGTNIDTTATPLTDAVGGGAGPAWTVTNQGKLLGANLGVFLLPAGSSLTNSDTISGAANNGVQLLNGGTIINQVGGTITGALNGAMSDSGTISNAGTITGGSISAGVLFTGNNGTVTNTGTISGGLGVEMLGPGGTVTNSGTISGAGGASGASVSFEGSGINTLTLQTGSKLTGDALGSVAAGATNNLILQGHGTASNNFQNFNTLDVQADTAWVWNNAAQIGATTVSSGTLMVDGTLSSAVTVMSGSTLAGHGLVNGNVSVASGATVAPGAPGALVPFSTLSVNNGNVTFAAGSVFQVNVNAAGKNDALAIIGQTNTATLGGTVRVLAQSGGTFLPSTRYTILTAAAGGLGPANGNTFGSVAANLPFLSPSLSYDANDVFLTLLVTGTQPGTPGATGFTNTAQTRNQSAVAGALDASAVTNPLLLALLNQTSAAGARQAFDALSGEVFGSVQNTQMGQMHFTRDAMLGRMRQASYYYDAPGGLGALSFGGPELAYASGDAGANTMAAFPGKAPARVAGPSRDLTFWAQGLGGWGHVDSDGNAASVKSRFGGFLSGADARLGDTLRAGLVAGYMRTNLNVDDRSSSAGIDSVQFGAYAGGRLGAFNVRGGASYSYDSIDTSRGIVFPGFTDKANAHFHGNVGQVFGEVGYGMTLGQVAVEPLAGLAYVHVRDGSFLETGGLAALSASSANESTGYSSLGVRAATTLPLANGTVLVPRGSVQWQHAFGDVTPVTALAFQSTGTAFTVAGVPIARNTALVEGGFDWRFSPQAKLGAFYQGELAAHAQTHAFKGGLTWDF